MQTMLWAGTELVHNHLEAISAMLLLGAGMGYHLSSLDDKCVEDWTEL